MTDQTNQYKLIMVGDGGVGKTCFLTKKMMDRFEKRYIATLGVEVHPIIHEKDGKRVIFNVWDTAGQEKFGGLRDGYYIQGDCAIVMCDILSGLSIKSIDTWIRDLKRVCDKPDFEIVVVANKFDVINGQKEDLWNQKVKELNEKGYKTFLSTCRNGYSKRAIDEIFDYLMDKMENKNKGKYDNILPAIQSVKKEEIMKETIGKILI